MRELADVIAITGDQANCSTEKATVSGVGTDGTISIDTVGDDIGLVTDVPCLSSYVNRTEGDVVLVLVSKNGRVVVGKIGDEDPIPDEVQVRWGAGTPGGTGWNADAGASVFAKENIIYVKTAAPTPPPPPPPRASIGGSATISPSNEGAYRDGGIETSKDHPIQGAWPSYPHPYSGLWIYGTAIASACSGNTVDRMTITMSRLSGSGGIYGGAQMRLYLHGYTSRPTSSPTLSSLWNAGTLTPGSKKTIQLPSSWVSALASGSARGVGCKAGTGSDYLSYGACGVLKIYFS